MNTTINEEMMKSMGTGAFQSPHDDRHWTLAAVGAPTLYDQSCFIDQAWQIPRMQNKLGCCVGCTFEEIVAQMVHAISQATGVPYQELSYRFVYAVCKCLDGMEAQGTNPALCAKVVRTYGVPLAKFCPNDTTLDHETFVYNRNLRNIPQEAFNDALTRRSTADFDVPVTEDGIMQAITYAKANGGGVAVLRQIGNTYWTAPNGNPSWDASGPNSILPIQPTANTVSGHEEFLYGYDHEAGTGRLRVYWLNHWSDSWASKGRAWEYADVWLKYVTEIRVVVSATPTVIDFKYHFANILKRGMQGADVVALQHVLKLEGIFPETQPFTGYFGDITFNDVVQLQQKYASEILAPLGLTHGTGAVGEATLAWLNKKYNS